MAPVVVLPRAIGPMGAAGVQRVRVRAPRWAPAIAPAYVTTANSAFRRRELAGVLARGRRGSRVSAPPTCCPLAGGVQIPVQIGGRGSRFHDQIRVTVLTVSGLSRGPGLGLWVHGMPDTALQNDRVCASWRTKPDGMDLRQNGGYLKASLSTPHLTRTFAA